MKTRPFLAAVLFGCMNYGLAQPPTNTTTGKFRPRNAGQPQKIVDEKLKGLPFAPGWPLLLPGNVTGAPVIADLDGDKQKEIVVASMSRSFQGEKVLHPNPDLSALLWAFHADGTPVKGWPAVLLDENERLVMQRDKKGAAEIWFASPTVCDADNDGKDEIVTTIPGGGVRLINGEGKVSVLADGTNGDAWVSIPAVDLNANEMPDVLAGWVLRQAKGGPVKGWPADRIFKGGYAPCVGDAEGDGSLEIYHGFYADRGVVSGFDNEGNALPGWPQKVAGQMIYPVMGNVTGDEKMEVCGVDGSGNLHAWTWDGQKLPGTRQMGDFSSVLANNVHSAHQPPALADLDGDGKAEIIVFDGIARAIRAWKEGAIEIQTAGGPLVRLPHITGWPSPSVTIADLGGDGEMDIFCGTYWVHLKPDGIKQITNLLPSYAPTSTEITLADLDGDGTGEAIFGLTDGRLFVYQTGKTLQPENIHWITRGGNFQHTSCWQSPKTPLVIN